MRGSLSYFGLLVLVIGVIHNLLADGCTDQEGMNYRSTLYTDRLLKLLKDDDTTAFYTEAESVLGQGSPTIQDLTDMFNDYARGKLPQYLVDKNYKQLCNMTSVSLHENLASGISSSYCYGSVESTRNIGSFSSVSFVLTNTSPLTSSNYDMGRSTYFHASYNKGETFLNFHVSLLKAVLHRLPNGTYISRGNVTGIAEGNGVRLSDKIHEISVKTFGIMHTSTSYSKKVVVSNVKETNEFAINNFNMLSLSHGSNATFVLHATPPRGMEEKFTMNMNGTVKSHEKEILSLKTTTGSLVGDVSNPYSDRHLHNYFWIPTLGLSIV